MSRLTTLVASLAALATLGSAADTTPRTVRLAPTPQASLGAVMTASVLDGANHQGLIWPMVSKAGVIYPGQGATFAKDSSEESVQLGGAAVTFTCSRDKQLFAIKGDKGAVTALKQGPAGFDPVVLPLADKRKLALGFPVARLAAKGECWLGLRAAVAGKGTLDGETISLIDDNLDGTIDASDGIAIGASSCFAPLAKRIATRKGVYAVTEVAADGGKAVFTPEDGDTVACTSLFTGESAGQAVIASADGSLVAVLTGDKAALKLPAGAYKLRYGAVYGPKGKVMAVIVPGKFPDFTVEAPAADAKKKAPALAFGGPFELAFQARIDGAKVIVEPMLDLYGAAKEQYRDFRLVGTPVVYVNGKQNGSMGFG